MGNQVSIDIAMNGRPIGDIRDQLDDILLQKPTVGTYKISDCLNENGTCTVNFDDADRHIFDQLMNAMGGDKEDDGYGGTGGTGDGGG